jgi:hypothetical protein
MTNQQGQYPEYPQHGQYPRQEQYPYQQPTPGYPTYQQQQPTGYAPYPPAAPTNTLAIITIIAAFVMPIVGIVTGHIALSQLRTSGEQGAGLAKAGLIISYIYAGLVVVIVVLSIVAPLLFLAIMAPIIGSMPTST